MMQYQEMWRGIERVSMTVLWTFVFILAFDAREDQYIYISAAVKNEFLVVITPHYTPHSVFSKSSHYLNKDGLLVKRAF